MCVLVHVLIMVLLVYFHSPSFLLHNTFVLTLPILKWVNALTQNSVVSIGLCCSEMSHSTSHWSSFHRYFCSTEMLSGGTVSLVNFKMQRKWIVWGVACHPWAPFLSCLCYVLSKKNELRTTHCLFAQQSNLLFFIPVWAHLSLAFSARGVLLESLPCAIFTGCRISGN